MPRHASTVYKKMNEENIEQKIKPDSYQFLGSVTERVVFLLILTLISAGPIIFGKSIPSHADWHIHIEHAYNFKRCFWQGQWLPRWIDTQVNGYGLPIFNYYAPLVYYLFTFLELIFRNPILSIKWAFIIPMILCTIFGYLYLRRHGSSTSAALATAFIIFSPAIHIFIYNTNWPTSTLALAFLFLTLYGIDSFDKSKNFDLKSFLITSFGYAGMALAHLATAFMFTLISIPYFILNLYIHRTSRFLKNFVFSLCMGAGLAGFYLFPACFEKNLVHTDEVLTQGPLWDFSKNFLFTYLDRNTDEGYAWGIFDHRFYEVSNAIFGLAVMIFLIILLLNMDNIKKYFSEPFRIKIAIAMFLICFIMMTPISIFVWLMLKPMQTVQFPWRFTSFIVPFGGLIMVYGLDLVGKLTREKISVGGYKFLLYCVIALFSMLVYVDVINMYRWKWVPEQSLLKASTFVLWGNEEYRPNITGDPNWKQINFRSDFSPSIQSSNLNCDINIIKWLSHERIFEVFSLEEHQLRIRTFYFPGWNIYLDGKKSEIRIDPRTGSMLVKVPYGKHRIEIKFELTPIRKTSGYISLVALIIYASLLINIFSGKTFQLQNFRKKEDEAKEKEESSELEVPVS